MRFGESMAENEQTKKGKVIKKPIQEKSGQQSASLILIQPKPQNI